MARPTSTDGDIESLGTLITAAFELDRSWYDKGACSGWHRKMSGPTPWQQDPTATRDGYADEMIAVALIICQTCPVQYQCAKYAVEGRMLAGTWGMHPSDLVWLGRPANAKQAAPLLRAAEAAGIPAQRAVRVARDASKT